MLGQDANAVVLSPPHLGAQLARGLVVAQGAEIVDVIPSDALVTIGSGTELGATGARDGAHLALLGASANDGQSINLIWKFVN